MQSRLLLLWLISVAVAVAIPVKPALAQCDVKKRIELIHVNYSITASAGCDAFGVIVTAAVAAKHAEQAPAQELRKIEKLSSEGCLDNRAKLIREAKHNCTAKAATIAGMFKNLTIIMRNKDKTALSSLANKLSNAVHPDIADIAKLQMINVFKIANGGITQVDMAGTARDLFAIFGQLIALYAETIPKVAEKYFATLSRNDLTYLQMLAKLDEVLHQKDAALESILRRHMNVVPLGPVGIQSSVDFTTFVDNFLFHQERL